MTAIESRMLITASVLIAVVATGALGATEPPDLEQNQVTGYVESVDIAPLSGNRVRHVEDQGPTGSRTATLISTAAGSSPRIAIKSNGDSWVVWWRNTSTDEIRYSFYDVSASTWRSEAVISESDEDSSYPELAHEGSTTWVVFEADDGSGETTIAVSSIIDSPEPFGARVAIASTDFSGELDVQIQVYSGHLWVTWVDSSSEVGWSEYDHNSETWDSPEYEDYTGSTVKAARESILEGVVGN